MTEESGVDDPDRSAVYGVQDELDRMFADRQDRSNPWAQLGELQVRPFVDDVLDKVGAIPRRELNIQFLPPETAVLAGRYDREADCIFLHPQALTYWKILHEVAHWLDPTTCAGVTHGPEFRTIYLALVAAGIGVEPSEEMGKMYQEDRLFVLPNPRPWETA